MKKTTLATLIAPILFATGCNSNSKPKKTELVLPPTFQATAYMHKDNSTGIETPASVYTKKGSNAMLEFRQLNQDDPFSVYVGFGVKF